MLFQQINIKDQVEYYNQGPTESPAYVGGKLNSQYSNVYLLTNTKKDTGSDLTSSWTKAHAPMRLGHGSLNINWSAAYTYGVVKDMMQCGIRNSFQSNAELNPAIVANNPTTGLFQLRSALHRIVATLGSSWIWNDKTLLHTTFLFHSGQSGSPIQWYIAQVVLLLVMQPTSTCHIYPRIKRHSLGWQRHLTAAQQWQDLNNLIENDKYTWKQEGGQICCSVMVYVHPGTMSWTWSCMHTFNLSAANKQHTHWQ